MIFLFFGERGKRGKGFRVANVNWGFEGLQVTSKLPASYPQVREWWLDEGGKSGIWRFYKRVWKNIFYERRDKERKGGFLGMEGDFWVMYGKGCNMEYSLMECFL